MSRLLSVVEILLLSIVFGWAVCMPVNTEAQGEAYIDSPDNCLRVPCPRASTPKEFLKCISKEVVKSDKATPYRLHFQRSKSPKLDVEVKLDLKLAYDYFVVGKSYRLSLD